MVKVLKVRPWGDDLHFALTQGELLTEKKPGAKSSLPLVMELPHLEVRLDAHASMALPLSALPPLGPAVGHLFCQFLACFFPGFPPHRPPPLPAPAELRPHYRQDRPLLFYPGSFYPWHRGHQACLELAPHRNIVVVPDANPLKEQRIRDPLQEVLFLRQKTGLSVYPGFIGGPKNPTVEWLPRVQAPARELMMGMDTFAGLAQWREVSQLLAALKRLYVVPRQGDFPSREELCQWIEGDFPHLEVVFLPHHAYEHLSSTFLRGGR